MCRAAGSVRPPHLVFAAGIDNPAVLDRLGAEQLGA